MAGQVDEAAFSALLSDAATHDFLLQLVCDASRGRVIGGVSHQLRNSLNSILNGVQLLEERGADPELRAKLLPVMSRSAQRMGQMLDALDPPPSASSSGVDLRKLVQDTLVLLGDQSLNVQIESFEGRAIMVRGESRELRHMLLTLLLSHLVCKPTQMRIAVKTEAQNAELQIENLAAASSMDKAGLALVLQTALIESLGGSIDRDHKRSRSTLTLARVLDE